MKLPPSIEESANTVFLVDRRGRLVDHNAAYERFAATNNGSALLSTWGRGCDMYACLPEPLRHEMVSRYEQAWRSGVVDYRYQCHSPELFRVYSMRLLPFGDGCILSEHALVVSRPMRGVTALPEAEIHRQFTDHQGLIKQCCSCRKVRSPGAAEEWAWVETMFTPPAQLAKAISHDLCPVCLETLHPE